MSNIFYDYGEKRLFYLCAQNESNKRILLLLLVYQTIAG